MASLKKYCIVEFPEPDGSKAVEVVPNKWLDCANSLCYWPPRAGVNLKCLVRKLVIPKKDWTKFKFNRIFGSYDDYEKAYRKCTTAEYTSNVESESNAASPAVVNKRSLRKNGRAATRSKTTPRVVSSDDTYDESSECEELILPDLPTLLNPAARVVSDEIADSIRYGELNNPIDSNKCQSNPELPFNLPSTSTSLNFVGVSLGLIKNESSKPGSPDPNFESSMQDDSFNQESMINTPSISLMSLDANSPANVLPSQADILNVQNQLNEFAAKVFHILEKQNDDIREIKAYLHAFRHGATASIPDYSNIPALPLLDLVKLDELEDWLNLDANKQLLSEYLALIGGDNVEKNTRRVLRRVFSPALSKLINFTGKGEKRALKHLRIFSSIKSGIRIGKPTAQDDVIEQTAINWFRFSKSPKPTVHNQTTL